MKVRTRRSEGGFSLAEVVVALAVVLLAMLLGLSLFWQQPRVLERLRAHEEALRAIEATLETMRAGALPLASGAVRWPIPAPPGIGAGGLVMSLEVGATPTPGLYEVVVTASYRDQVELRQRTVRTMVWRP